MEPDAVQRENKPLECRFNLLGALSLLMVVLLSSLAQAEAASSTKLFTAIRQLAEHINETSILNTDQITRHTATIRKNIDLIGETSNFIGEALHLVASYESAVGPLFMNQTTRGGFPRKPAGGLELDRALFAIQQDIIELYFPDGRPKG